MSRMPSVRGALPGPQPQELVQLHARPPAGVPLRAPCHPGRFLDRMFLAPLALTQTDAARLLGISRRRVNEIIMGHRSMSPDTAVRCAMVFGVPASVWLSLQSRWDSFHAWKALRHALPRAAAR